MYADAHPKTNRTIWIVPNNFSNYPIRLYPWPKELNIKTDGDILALAEFNILSKQSSQVIFNPNEASITELLNSYVAFAEEFPQFVSKRNYPAHFKQVSIIVKEHRLQDEFEGFETNEIASFTK